MKKAVFIILAFVILSAPKGVFATSVSFPLCANPTGSIVANYPSGTHGILGSTASYSGSDTVYQVNPNQYTQCFCPDNGQGIQTNWLNAKGLSQDEVDVYTHNGWTYIADGSVWGLSADPYLAQNSSFTCGSSNNGGGSNNNGGSNNSNNSSNNNSSNGSVLGAAASILSLANTGNMPFILSVFGLGVIFTGLGLIFKYTKRS